MHHFVINELDLDNLAGLHAPAIKQLMRNRDSHKIPLIVYKKFLLMITCRNYFRLFVK
jgi:hypothetical protein